MRLLPRTLILLLATHATVEAFGVLSANIICPRRPLCEQLNGSLVVSAQGGVSPYTYLWSTGATATSIGGLGPGTYSVTVTDATMAQVQVSHVLTSTNTWVSEPTMTIVGLPTWPSPTPGMVKCAFSDTYMCHIAAGPCGACDPVQPTSEWTFVASPVGGFGHWVRELEGYMANGIQQVLPPNYFNHGSFGCPGTVTMTVGRPIEWPSMSILNVEPQCGTVHTGAITAYFSIEGHAQPVRYGVYRASDNAYITSGTCGNQAGPVLISGLQANAYWVRLSLIGGDATAPLGPEAYVVVPSNPNCRTLTGYAYLDANKDCVKQGGEPYLPNIPLVATPGPYYTSTDMSGNYRFSLPLGGTYSVSETATNVNQLCPSPGTTVTLSNNAVQNLADTSIAGMDVRASIASGPARPGFQMNYSASAANRSYTSSGTYSFTVSYNPILTYISATPAPTTTAAGLLTWTGQSALDAFASRGYSISLQVPADVGLLGTVLSATATATLQGSDVDLSNNTATSQTTITGSYDPNDKLARTSSGASSTQYFLGQDQWIDYTLRFQNTGTDTAFTVIVTDTLPSSLDPSTLEWGSTSHTSNMKWTTGQVIRVAFPAINLPQSALNEPGSHGHISFRIRPRNPVVAGTVITNRANIYFDFNPPIITDPSVLTTTNQTARIQAKAFLLGPYVEATQLMNDDLRAANRIPLLEPYTALGYPAYGDGGETTTAAVLAVTGNNAIVDWVLLELRVPATPTQIVATRRALIQRDGDIVDVDGTSPVRFNAAINTSYKVSVKHRSHLGCMTADAYWVDANPAPVDLSAASETTYGGSTARKIMGTKAALWSGNVNSNGTVKYVGANNDRDPILLRIGGSMPTNTLTGYWREDVDMNGTVRYIGAANDRDPILLNIGGSLPTSVLNQQLP